MKCPTSILTLETSLAVPAAPEKLRGNIASKNLDKDIYHQHSGTGLIYKYPRIHYHVIDGVATVTGWLEGVEETKVLFRQTKSIEIGYKKYQVIRKELKITDQEFGLTKEKQRYRFIYPWIALNSANYQKYKGYNGTEKKMFLEKILTGNLLSVSKGLGYTVNGRIDASIIYVRSKKCSLKGTSILGFNGAFEVNFALPKLIGLGKSVSRGYGAVERV